MSKGCTFLVITHNGEMPKDGGKRLGYQVTHPDGRVWITNTTGQVVSISRPQPEEPPVNVSELRTVSRYLGNLECNRCDSTNLEKRHLATTDGNKDLIVCKDCGLKMLPRPAAEALIIGNSFACV